MTNTNISDIRTALINGVAQNAANSAVKRAGNMTAQTWHTEMLIDRIVNPAYDIRTLAGDFSDIEAKVTLSHYGLTTVVELSHLAYDYNASKPGLKRLNYLFTLNIEKYDTGRKHANGDPVKGYRYRLTQVPKVDVTALQLGANNGATLKELKRIQNKRVKGSKPLTAAETELLELFARNGVSLNSLEELIEGKAAGFTRLMVDKNPEVETQAAPKAAPQADKPKAAPRKPRKPKAAPQAQA